MRQTSGHVTPPKLLIVATEDWFFVSHFLSVACAARDAGFTVSVHVRVRTAELRAGIEAEGIRVLPSNHRRGHFGPLAMVAHVGQFARLLRRERPDVVHLISVRLIVLGGLAALLAGARRRVHAVTGLGLMGASRSRRAKIVLWLLGWLLRGPLAGRRVVHVFENREDPVLLGMDPDGARIAVVGGAGIDPMREAEQPLPPGPSPLRLALVARMIHSKGVDVAVEAVRRARLAGHEVELTLAGGPDSHNPRAFTANQLAAWGREPGVTWIGHASDVKALWRDHHVVCVPSRGGEGLPRALLEGAAAGRAILTTRTPGCATFTRDGLEGFVVPPDDAGALADAMGRLADDGTLVARMGRAARARVLEGFTAEAVARAFVTIYRALSVDRRA